jgi:hypothetical protein
MGNVELTEAVVQTKKAASAEWKQSALRHAAKQFDFDLCQDGQDDRENILRRVILRSSKKPLAGIASGQNERPEPRFPNHRGDRIAETDPAAPHF